MLSSKHQPRGTLVTAAVTGYACLVAATAMAQAQPAAPTPAPQSPPYKLVVDPSTVTAYLSDKPLMRYRYTEVPAKPYVDRFYTPSGVNILRDQVADHKHHHGLMFALAVDGVDFWSETPGCGMQAHQELNDVRTGSGGEVQYAGFVDGKLAWVDPRSKTATMFEDRRVEVVQMKGQKATLLTWETLLTLPEGKATATITGAEYFGLGMRFVPSMDKGGKFINADGKTGVQDTNAARSAWCAYSASADGKPVTVAVFDHPTNPRRPATWFTMDTPFAYLAATMNLSKEQLVLKEDQPLLLRYGVALWDGHVDAREIDGLCRQWTALFQPPQPPGPGPTTQPGEPPPAPQGPGR